jgi:hypothetical protein
VKSNGKKNCKGAGSWHPLACYVVGVVALSASGYLKIMGLLNDLLREYAKLKTRLWLPAWGHILVKNRPWWGKEVQELSFFPAAI